jgi:hypothetical protein
MTQIDPLPLQVGSGVVKPEEMIPSSMEFNSQVSSSPNHTCDFKDG